MQYSSRVLLKLIWLNHGDNLGYAVQKLFISYYK